MKNIFNILSVMLLVFLLNGCTKDKPDIQVPDIINPADLNGYILLFVSQRASISTDINWNGSGTYNYHPAGTPFQLVGYSKLHNRFFGVRKYSPTLGDTADYFWNIDYAPFYIWEGLTLDSGETVTVYKVMANFGNADAGPSKVTSSITYSVQGGVATVIDESSHSTAGLKAKDYVVLSDDLIYNGEGLYNLAYRADANKEVDENNEDNNFSNTDVVNIDIH
jgi:hypothetical protein